MYLLILILVMIGAASADLDTCDNGIQCGNKCALCCSCGQVLVNYYSDEYCCTATPEKCELYNNSHTVWSAGCPHTAWSVGCQHGQPINKNDPCHGKCYNNYEDHIHIAEDGHYTCPGGDQCVRVQDMCQGVSWCGTRGLEEAAICGPDLKCPFVVNMRNNRSDYNVSHIKNTEVVRCVSKLQVRT